MFGFKKKEATKLRNIGFGFSTVMDTKTGSGCVPMGNLTSCRGSMNVVIGPGNVADHNHCVLIGSDLKTSEDYQLIIGNRKIQTSRLMTEPEFKEVYSILRKVAERMEIK